jgi:hypothetical protein
VQPCGHSYAPVNERYYDVNVVTSAQAFQKPVYAGVVPSASFHYGADARNGHIAGNFAAEYVAFQSAFFGGSHEKASHGHAFGTSEKKDVDYGARFHRL